MKRLGRSTGKKVLRPDAAGLAEASAILRKGGIVAFPTETSYGLGSDPFNESALKRIFALKQRPRDKPLLLIIDHQGRLPDIVAMVPRCYEPLMERFWPGPLTLIFPALPGLPGLLTGETGSVGVRVSSEQVALELCRRFNGPITATSANISGREPAHSVQEVLEQFPEGLDAVLDGGNNHRSLPSTIVGEEEGSIRVIRPGVIARADLLSCLPR